MKDAILTPLTLWQDFNDALPLKVVNVNSVNQGNVQLNYLYFSGRKVQNSRVRIYGIFAEHKNKSKGSLLILPDVNDVIDLQSVLYLSSLGYDVLSVDLKGENPSLKDYTKYPSEIYYANYDKRGRTFDYVDTTAKETCWYEWTSVARYAVSFLKSKNPNSKVGVIGVRQSANVLWQLAGTDKRIDLACFLFGAGWLAYKNLPRTDGTHIEIDDERYKFIAGIEAQSYAQFVTCPVLYLSTTNSPEFDCERAVDTLSRVSNDENCRFNFITNSINLLDFKCLKNLELFLDKYVNDAQINISAQPKIEISSDGEDFIYAVEVDNSSQVESICVYASSNDLDIQDRVWYKVELEEQTDNGEFIFKRRAFGKCEYEIAFAQVYYKNGFTFSSKFAYLKVDFTTQSNVPNVLFSSSKLLTNFLAEDSKENSILSGAFSRKNSVHLKKGPHQIVGLWSNSALVTYAIKKLTNKISDDSFIKLDVYSSITSSLQLSITLTDGNVYFVSCKLDGGEFWQNLQVYISDFKDANGMAIKDYSKIHSLKISSIGEYAINNVILI